MSTKNKIYLNWYFILIGILALYFGFGNSFSSIENKSLKTLYVELKEDIDKHKGKRRRYDYRIWTTEYEAQFIIREAGIGRENHGSISELKKGQHLQLQIKENDKNRLHSIKSEITVYGVKVNNKNLLSTEEYKTNRKKYLTRLNVISIFMGFMFLLNGLILIRKKINYTLIGIFIIVLITMYVFRFGIY